MNKQLVISRFMMLWRSDIWPTMVLGLPLIGAQLAQMAINATDVLMIARLGSEKLAASVLAFNMYIMLWFFGMGVIQAVIPLGAKAYGRRELRDFRRVVRMGLWFSIVYCGPAWCVTFYAEEILLLLKQDPEISRLAGVYMTTLQWTLLPALALMAVRGFMTVTGHTAAILVATLVGVVLNIVLDYVLIFGHFGFPRLELVGAGLASFFSSAMSLVFIVVFVMRDRKLRRYSIFGRFWRVDWVKLWAVVRVGVPIALTIIAEASLFSGSAVLMGWMGPTELAAHGIALQIVSITFMVPVGLSQACLTRVGRAHGRGDDAAVSRAGWAALITSLVFMLCFAIVFWVFPEALVSLYLNPADPDAPTVLTYAVSFLGVAAIFQLFDGGQIIGVNNLRGIGDTTVPLIYAAIGYWVIGFSLSIGLGFGAGWGGVGVWSGLAGGLCFVAVLANVRFYRRKAVGLV